MHRIPEPELMDSAEQARAYAEADFGESNRLFLDEFTRRFPSVAGGCAVDLGCGPADIAIDFALAHPDSRVIAVDGAPHMLDFGRRRIAALGIGARVTLQCHYLDPDSGGEICPAGGADILLSNSLLHHLEHPDTLWRIIARLGRAGSAVLVMDLRRPASQAAAHAIVAEYAAGEAEILREDFYHSLLAAYTVDEVREQLARCGLGHLEVSLPSDRHLLVSGLLR